MKKKIKGNKSKNIESENDYLKNQLARVLADYDNLRKRTESERGDYKKFANLTLILRLLPVFDMLYEAQDHLGDTGIAITIAEFEKVLKEEGVQKIEVKKGNKFNEHLHEAVEVAAKGKKGEVMDQLLVGWKYLNGPVIRHAKVKVSG